MLSLPGTGWLPPGSLSVMGLEWRSRYWSSSLLQQREKHLSEKHQSHRICVFVGKESLEGGGFIWELVVAAVTSGPVVAKDLRLLGAGQESTSVPWLGRDGATGALIQQEGKEAELTGYRQGTGCH